MLCMTFLCMISSFGIIVASVECVICSQYYQLRKAYFTGVSKRHAPSGLSEVDYLVYSSSNCFPLHCSL